MTTVIHDLRVNGTYGYRFTRDGDTVWLDMDGSQLTLPMRNVNLVAYQRIRYPFFLWAAVICFIFGGLATTTPRPAIGEYEIVDWYWWVLISAAFVGLYNLIRSAAVVVASGTTRTILRGSPSTMLSAYRALQP